MIKDYLINQYIDYQLNGKAEMSIETILSLAEQFLTQDEFNELVSTNENLQGGFFNGK